MIEPNDIESMIQEAAYRAKNSGVEIVLDYTDKSIIYNEEGQLLQDRDFQVRIIAKPKPLGSL